MTKAIISGKFTGDIIGSTYVKKGRAVQLFEKFDGFGISRHMLNNPRIKNIRIHFKGKVYKTNTLNFLAYGIPYHKPGYEPQYILPRDRFEVLDADQTELL